MQLAPEIDSHALKRLTRRRFLRRSNERSPFFLVRRNGLSSEGSVFKAIRKTSRNSPQEKFYSQVKRLVPSVLWIERVKYKKKDLVTSTQK